MLVSPVTKMVMASCRVIIMFFRHYELIPLIHVRRVHCDRHTAVRPRLRHPHPRGPAGLRRRGAEVPPVRPRRRGETDGGLRCAGRGVHRDLRADRPGRRGDRGPRREHRSDVRRRGARRDRAPARAIPGRSAGRPPGVREAGHAVRGALRVLGADGRDLLDRGRVAADGPDGRGGDRGRASRGVAAPGGLASPGGGLAGRRRSRGGPAP